MGDTLHPAVAVPDDENEVVYQNVLTPDVSIPDNRNKAEDSNTLPPGCTTQRLGIYRLIFADTPRKFFSLPAKKAWHKQYEALMTSLPALLWFLGEVYSTDPWLLAMYLVCESLLVILPALEMYLWTSLLGTVSTLIALHPLKPSVYL
jgi:hypothetical protein